MYVGEFGATPQQPISIGEAIFASAKTAVGTETSSAAMIAMRPEGKLAA